MVNYPDEIKQILDVLSQNNFQCYLVGGCVRDSLIGAKSFDFDVSTDAHPDNLMKLFSHLSPRAMYPYGISLKVGSFNVEITTMRLESTASNGRHPNTIQYTSRVEDDILRRDFTMNSLYYSPNTGIIDLVGGMDDIRNKVIKSIGTPTIRLQEDYVRILRVLAFKSRLDFRVDESLKLAALSLSFNVNAISASQKFNYLTKILRGAYIHDVKDDYDKILFQIIPELEDAKKVFINTCRGEISLYDYTFEVIAKVKDKPELKYAALFHNLGLIKFDDEPNNTGSKSVMVTLESQNIAKAYLDSFNMSKKRQKSVHQMIEMVDIQAILTLRGMQRFIYEYGIDATEDFLSLKEAIFEVRRNDQGSRCSELFKEVLENNHPISMSDLVVKTEDLLAHGIPIKIARNCLTYAFVAYLSGALDNEVDDIVSYCKGVYRDQYSI